MLCIIDLMVLQHRADTEDSVAAVIRDMCSFEFLSVYENWVLRMIRCDNNRNIKYYDVHCSRGGQ